MILSDCFQKCTERLPGGESILQLYRSSLVAQEKETDFFNWCQALPIKSIWIPTEDCGNHVCKSAPSLPHSCVVTTFGAVYGGLPDGESTRRR